MNRFLETLTFMFAASCDQATRLMSDSLERKLSFVERFALIGHMASCKTGRRFRRQMKAMRKQLQTAVNTNEQSFADPVIDEQFPFRLSPNARVRIKRELQQANRADQ